MHVKGDLGRGSAGSALPVLSRERPPAVGAVRSSLPQRCAAAEWGRWRQRSVGGRVVEVSSAQGEPQQQRNTQYNTDTALRRERLSPRSLIRPRVRPRRGRGGCSCSCRIRAVRGRGLLRQRPGHRGQHPSVCDTLGLQQRTAAALPTRLRQQVDPTVLSAVAGLPDYLPQAAYRLPQ